VSIQSAAMAEFEMWAAAMGKMVWRG